MIGQFAYSGAGSETSAWPSSPAFPGNTPDKNQENLNSRALGRLVGFS